MKILKALGLGFGLVGGMFVGAGLIVYITMTFGELISMIILGASLAIFTSCMFYITL